MPAPVLTRFPASITAGDTTRLQLSFADFPASAGWTGQLILNQIGSDPVVIDGTPSGDNFGFVITAEDSTRLTAGPCSWAARLTQSSSGDVDTGQGGAFTVLPNYAASIAKSTTQLQLDSANAAFSELCDNPTISVQASGQNFTKANLSELLNMIQRLEAKVKLEQAAAAGLRGDAPTRSIRPYFV